MSKVLATAAVLALLSAPALAANDTTLPVGNNQAFVVQHCHGNSEFGTLIAESPSGQLLSAKDAGAASFLAGPCTATLFGVTPTIWVNVYIPSGMVGPNKRWQAAY